MDSKEVDRLAGKIVSDTRRKRGSGRYPWEFLNVLARHYLDSGAPATGLQPSTSSTSEDAQAIADKLSNAQREAMRGLFNEGKAEGAGAATMGALVNKGLLVEAGEAGEYEISILGNAVCAILATQAA